MKQRNAGFTLIEMMVALAIGGIMTVMAVPNLSDMREGYRLRAATFDVFAALQRARSEAVKKNNNYRFSLVDQTTYRMHDDTDDDGVVDAGETVTQRNVTLDAPGTKLFYWSPPFDFLPDGTRTGAWWTAVLVVNAQWEYKWIQVSPTGRIQVL